MRLKLHYLLIPIALLLFAASCKKQTWLTTGGEVQFSVDTFMFDTVFTALGSSTRSIKIFNPQKESIRLEKVWLEQGDHSPFRLNINGFGGKEIEHLDVAGKDSLWVFADVTIDPNNDNNPFFIEDKLMVRMNDRTFELPILAFGQNAYYVVDSVLETQTWKADKPYVIMHNALVNENAVLTIEAGTRVYMHQDSRLFIQGTLKINGTKEDSVVFQGDRIDRMVYVGSYANVPGEWGGLYFLPESRNNVIDYAIFKNGGAFTKLGDQMVLGATIQINKDSIKTGRPMLSLTNSVIHHSQGYGIVAFNSSLYAANCLIAHCGAENVMLFEGGDYRIYDCTIATYGGASPWIDHSKNISMGVLNYYPVTQYTYTGAANLKLDMQGCIIYGNAEDEIFVNKKDDFLVNVKIQNCLMKTEEGLPDFVNSLNNIFNKNPQFADYKKMDFHLESGSPAIGAGVSIPGISKDLDGKLRATTPSIGCYEFE